MMLVLTSVISRSSSKNRQENRAVYDVKKTAAIFSLLFYPQAQM